MTSHVTRPGAPGGTPFWRAFAAVYRGQLSRARAGGGAVLFVAALQSVGILVLLRGTVGATAERSRAAMVAGTAVLVIAFVAVNLLAQRFGALKAGGGLDYYGTLPVSAAAVVLGIAAGYASFTVPGMVATAALGAVVFHLPVSGLWMLLPVLVTAGVSFSGLGAVLGLASPRPELATVAGQLGMTAVLFVGVIPPDRYPEALRGLRAALPITYDIDALAAGLTADPGWGGIALRLAGSVAFGVACLFVAARLYRRALDQ